MLASTVQFSTYDQTPATRPHQPRPRPQAAQRYEMQTGPAEKNQTPGDQPPEPALSGPNSVPTDRSCATTHVPHPPKGAVLARGRRCRPNWSAFHPRAPPHTHAGTPNGHRSRCGRGSGPPQPVWRPVLLRKEVIQPHLPVRLPCYDFVPIADPAFDGSLHKGWATGFGRYRLS